MSLQRLSVRPAAGDLRGRGAARRRLAGIPMLGLDALGSAAYGPEAALTLLIPLGAAGIWYIGPISTLIIILLDGRLLLLPPDDRRVSARRRVVHGRQGEPGHHCRPARGGGALARLRAGRGRGHFGGRRGAGLGLSRAAAHTLSLCLAILALITLVNLRGVRESGLAFMVPTYLFIVSLLAVLAIGVVKALWPAASRSPVAARCLPLATTGAASLWILMRAFASGCTAMTGVEAVSNGVTAFREPAVDHARRTLTAIIGLLAVMLAGIAYLCQAYGIGATEPGQPGYQSILSQLVAAVIGRGVFYYITIGSVLSCARPVGQHRLRRLPPALPRDRPGRLSAQRVCPPGPPARLFAGHPRPGRLSAGLLIAFGGITDNLIPLFAVGAFLAFTLSQAGMVAHWRRLGGRARREIDGDQRRRGRLHGGDAGRSCWSPSSSKAPGS